MKKILILFSFITFPLVLKGGLTGSGTYASPYSGTFDGDPQWNFTNFPSGKIYINDDITIDDELLTIEDGMSIIFISEGVDIIINGTGQLNASGETNSKITFTADDDNDEKYGETGERWGHLYFTSSGSSSLVNCIIEWGDVRTGSNTTSYGGAIYSGTSNLTVSYCTLRYNYASHGGGVLVFTSASPTISNCNIYSNTASTAGGGIYFYRYSNSHITNCQISNNSSGSTGGGGIFFGDYCYSIRVINCVIANNSASSTAGKNIEFYNNSGPNKPVIINSIIWGSDNSIRYSGGQTLDEDDFVNCAIQENTETYDEYTDCVYLSGTNTDASGPNFTNPATRDWSINFISPCRDEGVDSYSGVTIPTLDYIENPRIFTTDIGAYEVQYSRWTGTSSTAWGLNTNWYRDMLPESTSNAVIPDVSNDPSISASDVTLDNLVTESGGLLSIETDRLLTVTNLTNSGSVTFKPKAKGTITSLTNSGTLNLESDATGMFSIMFANYSGSGTVNAEIYFTGGHASGEAHRWHYMAVPKTMNKSELLSDITTDNLLLYDDSKVTTTKEQGWQWHDGYGGTSGFTNLDETRGYNFYHSNTSGATATLTSNSLLSTIGAINLQYSGPGSDASLYGWNLVGNSLTCALDWDNVTFSSGDIRDAVYYTKDDEIAAYVDGFGVGGGDKYVPPLQGFFVKTTATGQYITLTSAKVHATNQSYYKKGLSSPDKPHIRMEIYQGDNKDDMVVRFEKDATNQFDGHYDASKWISPAAIPQVYTSLSGEDYCINAVPYPATSGDIPIAIKIPADGNYIIRKTDLAGLDDYNIYLKDLQLDNTINLKETPEYDFDATTGTTTTRFVLTVTNIATGIGDVILPEKEFNIYHSFNMVNIQTLNNSWDGKPGSVKVYNLTGKIINYLSDAEFNRNSLIQVEAPVSKGLYIVEIKSGLKRYVGKVVIK